MIVGTKIDPGPGMNGRWFFESDDVNELRAAFGDYPWRVNERGKFEMPADGVGWMKFSIAGEIDAHTEIVFKGADKDSIAQKLARIGVTPLTDEEIERAKWTGLPCCRGTSVVEKPPPPEKNG